MAKITTKKIDQQGKSKTVPGKKISRSKPTAAPKDSYSKASKPKGAVKGTKDPRD